MIPPQLKFGQTIGVISPSSSDEYKVIDEHLTQLASLGFNINEGLYLRKKRTYSSTEDLERANELNHMFSNPNIDCIMCFRGGYGAIRILPYVNFKIIRKNPKIFIGYSDVTALLNAIYQNSGLITFHGPMVKSDFTNKITINSFKSVLMNNKTIELANLSEDNTVKFYNFDKVVSGVLVGGNLTTICSTIGTKYEIDSNNKILLLEDVDEPAYKIDRMLSQLILSKKLSNCKAIILGQFTNCPSFEQIIKDLIVTLEIPLCCNIMCGHTSSNITLPIGGTISIDSNIRKIYLSKKVIL